MLEPGSQLRKGFSPKQFKQEQVGRTPGTLVARKSLFQQIGSFNSSFIIGCDVEWFARAKDLNIAAAYVPQTLLYKRVHDSNLSANSKTNRQEVLKLIKQSLDRRRYMK